MCKKLFKFEIIGIFVIIALGVLWHFLYELSNENMLEFYNDEHNVPTEFEEILKERLKK